MKEIDRSHICCKQRSRFQWTWALSLVLVIAVASQLRAQQTASPAHVSIGYVLGPNDQITVSVVELPEFNAASYRIDEDGTVSLPLVGRVQAGGLTLAQLEENLRTALQTQVRTPHFVANVVESRSQTISVVGSVVQPGTQQIQGSKTLFDVIAAAGGLKTEAGEFVTITRLSSEGPLNLPGEVKDDRGATTTAQVKVRDLLELRNSRANIFMRAHDEVSVARAPVLYVIGNVRKPGGFTLSQEHPVSALEALSLAEGFTGNAASSNARILRRDSGQGLREQIPVNLKKILAGKAKDVPLSAGDILFVPDDLSRRVTIRVMETALATISGIVIWKGL